jgi:hypothetical protein
MEDTEGRRWLSFDLLVCREGAVVVVVFGAFGIFAIFIRFFFILTNCV